MWKSCTSKQYTLPVLKLGKFDPEGASHLGGKSIPNHEIIIIIFMYGLKSSSFYFFHNGLGSLGTGSL